MWGGHGWRGGTSTPSLSASGDAKNAVMGEMTSCENEFHAATLLVPVSAVSNAAGLITDLTVREDFGFEIDPEA